MQVALHSDKIHVMCKDMVLKVYHLAWGDARTTAVI